jgi:hypothetical protein
MDVSGPAPKFVDPILGENGHRLFLADAVPQFIAAWGRDAARMGHNQRGISRDPGTCVAGAIPANRSDEEDRNA